MNRFEIYEHPDGIARFYIEYSDKKFSTGLLVLNPGIELPKHNRPFLEILEQKYGYCVIKLFNGDKIEEKPLKEGDSLEIPIDQYHIHSNPSYHISITRWRAEGNITEIIGKIKNSYIKI